MMTLEEITVEERIRELQERIQQLEDWLTDVANDFITHFMDPKDSDGTVFAQTL